jgi:phosphate-selective porin
MPSNTTLIVQALQGDTSVGASADGRGALIGEYWSYFLLASQQLGAHRVSARYDRMVTESVRGAQFFNSAQTAIGWTFAYLWDASNAWQLGLELVEIHGSVQYRARRGLPAQGNERNVQLAIRYSL